MSWSYGNRDNRRHFAVSSLALVISNQLYCYLKTDYSDAGKYCAIHSTFFDSFEVNVISFFERKILIKCSGLHTPRSCGELDTD
jgi:hypothetical protein